MCVPCCHGMHPLHCHKIEHFTLSYREALSARNKLVMSPEMERTGQPKPSSRPDEQEGQTTDTPSILPGSPVYMSVSQLTHSRTC